MSDEARAGMNADIVKNIESIRGRISAAAGRSGRKAEDILLVAVSKTRSPEEILVALKAGAAHLGENKAQEMESKFGAVEELAREAEISTKVKWHMIGHLQRNKVKYIIKKADLIHSVDSLRLAEEIENRSALAGMTTDILVQVNIAGEESKSGVAPDEAAGLVNSILIGCAHIRVCGLMTVAPAAEDPEEVRGDFRRMKDIYDKIQREGPHERKDFKWLSMGMTGDFEVAIEEGANLVRVGTGIFGERNYNRRDWR